MPPSRWPFLDHPGPLAFAHRGGAGDAPENTMPAFAHAVGLGYRYLETDAHVTADGVVVAFHDDVLDRVTDRTGVIGALPWSEVAAATIGGESIPLLADLLDAFPDARINIDAKHDAVVEPLADLLVRMDVLDRVCVAAFSDRRLSTMRARCGPRLCTSMGPRAVARLASAARGVPVGRFRDACVQVPVQTRGLTLVDERTVAAAHRRGLQLHVWTIDDADEMHRLLDLGVDGIMTDRPAVLRDVLVARGAWH